MAKIHKLASVHPKAEIADDVEIGEFCKVGPNVKIGSGTKLLANCNIAGYTEVGCNNTIHPFVSLGSDPQDIGYKGLESYLKIGSGNTFREGFTANVGAKEGTSTIIGNNSFFMANSHVAHNAVLGNNVILANGAVLAGHVQLGDNCFIGGNSAVHQFVRIGRMVIMSGVSATSLDIPPFLIVDGRNKAIRNINLIGLKRNGLSSETISKIKMAFKIFFKSGLNIIHAIEKIKTDVEQIPEVAEFVGFVEGRNHRGIATGLTHDR